LGDPATKPEDVDRTSFPLGWGVFVRFEGVVLRKVAVPVGGRVDIEAVCLVGTVEVEELLGAEAATVLAVDWSSSIFVAVVEIMCTTCR